MKWFVVVLVVGALISAALVAFFRSNTPTQTQNIQRAARITLTPQGYEPNEVTIAVGSTVTFVNETNKPFWPASNLHPTHGMYPAFDPQRPLEPTEEWQFTFDRVGSHTFHDHIRSYFRGTIHVVAE